MTEEISNPDRIIIKSEQIQLQPPSVAPVPVPVVPVVEPVAVKVPKDEPPLDSLPLFSKDSQMVAKVTIETPTGSTAKYYLLYRDKCFSLRSLIVGAGGGVGLGFYTRAFFEQWRTKTSRMWTNQIPFPEVNISMKIQGRRMYFSTVRVGRSVMWRVMGRACVSSLMYSLLECQFQGKWHRKSYFDCGAAGAVTGAILGLRGIPGGPHGSVIGALGFGTFALLSRLIFL